MQFTLQSATGANLVRACSAAEVCVGEHFIRRSAILTAEQIVFDWPPLSVGELTPEHLHAALDLEPEVILLGTGERQLFPDPRIGATVQAAGVGFEVMDTRAACRTFNVLVQEGRRVVAALIVGSAPI